jgi:hypothetical protein
VKSCLPLGKGLGQYICCHVVCRAVHQLECSVLSDFSDKVITFVNVFDLRSIVVVFNESKHGLIVAI